MQNEAWMKETGRILLDLPAYDELIRYMKRMQQYEGGNDMVRELCREWIAMYPTRKVMVQELQTMIR